MGVQLRGGWGPIGRGVIAQWTKALGRDLNLIELARRRARRSPMSERGIKAMEEALWRLDAAREKLHAVIALSLGVRHLDVSVDPVRYKAFPNDIGATLRALQHPSAMALNDLGRQLAMDRAIRLRNELSHGVAPLTSVDVRCYFERVDVRNGSTGTWTSHVDYPPSWREHEDIGAQTLWSDAVADVGQALSMLVASVDALADLLERDGASLPPPARVYYDVNTQRASLSLPPRRMEGG